MASSISTRDTGQAAAATDGDRLRRMARRVKLAVGLIAIYGPPAVVVELHRNPLGKVYLVLGIWAVEGIIWYWLEGRVASRRTRHDGVSWIHSYN